MPARSAPRRHRCPQQGGDAHGQGTRTSGRLAPEWRAAEAAIPEIQTEIPYPLRQVVTDVEQALQRKSFHDRTAVNRLAAPTWNEGPP
jgi:hypothetical protein